MFKKLIVPILLIAALVYAGAAGLKSVKAEDIGSYPPIVQKLAQKFNLKEEDVKTAFDEERQDRRQEMQNLRNERLSQAVKNGIITDAQKQALINKENELRTKREQERSELEKWYSDQGIDRSKLAPYMGGGRGKEGFGGMGMKGW